MENKKSSKKLILISLLAFFVLGGASLFYYLKTQIKPDELKASIISKLEESIPGSDVSLGDLEVKYGTALIVKIKGMDILLKDSLVSKRDFLQVSDITIKLPLWSLLTGGGNLEVYLKKPELFLYRPEGKLGNWNLAFSSKKDDVKPIKKESAFKGSHNIILPAFLINSTAALRLSDFKIYYDISGKAGVWSASRLVLKNVGLRSNAAFEVESNFKRVLGDEEKFSFDTVLIGSIELEKYLKTGRFYLNSNYKIKNFKTREHPTVFPLIRGNTSLNIDKTGSVEATVSMLYQESELEAGIKASKSDKEIEIKKANIRFKDINPILPQWTSNFNLSQATIDIVGTVITSDTQPFKPTLKFKFSNIQYLKKSFPYKFDLSGTYLDQEVKTIFSGALWGGSLEGKAEGTFNINLSEPLEKRLSFYSADLSFKGNKIPEELLMVKEPNEEDESAEYVLLPKGIIGVNLENITLKKDVYSGGFSLKTEEESVKITNGALLKEEGKLTFESEAKLFKEEVNWKHKIKFEKFGGASLVSFLPKEVPFINGNITGDLSGKFKGHPLRGEEVMLNVTSPEGNFLNFDSSVFYKALSETSSQISYSYKTQKNNRDLPEYKDFSMTFIASKGQHQIKNLSFKDQRGYEVSLSGFIDPSKESKKRLIVHVKGDEDFQKTLQKRTKLRKLPLSFFTEGYSLALDELYSLKELSKKFRFKKDRTRMKKEILKVKAKNKGNENEKS